MKYQVVYYSETGNTEMIAKAMFEELPGENKDIQRLSEYKETEADLYLLGFWIYHGAASIQFLDFLSTLEGKRIALFATCGMGNTQKDYEKIERQIMAWLPESSKYLGLFMCQGKMPIAIRKACEQKKLETMESCENFDKLIANFDRALLHPDALDLKHAKEFVNQIIKK
jgi:flavodoxin